MGRPGPVKSLTFGAVDSGPGSARLEGQDPSRYMLLSTRWRHVPAAAGALPQGVHPGAPEAQAGAAPRAGEAHDPASAWL